MESDQTTPAPAVVRKLAEKLFLGPEFTTWLYFHLIEEGFEIDMPAVFPAGTSDDEVGVQFAIGKRASLRTLDASGARDALTGPGLDDNGEILQAIRRGALITVLSLECSIQSRVYSFTLNADDGGINGLRLPDLFTEPNEDGHLLDGEKVDLGMKRKRRAKLPLEDVLALRAQCMTELEKVLDFLFASFIGRRLSREWHTNEVAGIRKRVANGLGQRLVQP